MREVIIWINITLSDKELFKDNWTVKSNAILFHLWYVDQGSFRHVNKVCLLVNQQMFVSAPRLCRLSVFLYAVCLSVRLFM